MDCFAVVHTDGILTLQDLVWECCGKHWTPLLVLRVKGDPAQPPRVVLFPSQDIARRFSERNLPKTWLYGEFTIDDNDLKQFRELGWEYELYDFPFRVRRDLYDVGLEVYDISHYVKLDVTVKQNNICKKL